MATTAQQNINLASSNKWSLNLSNFPNMISSQNIQMLYETFVKSINLPPYNLSFIDSEFKDTIIHRPISKKNDEFESLSISFSLDENFENYFNLHLYLQKLRYSVDIPTTFLYQNTVRSIDVFCKNNQNISQKILRFSECMIENLGELVLEFGEYEAPSFTVDFKYREVLMVTADNI